jgi:hypothetical protein
MFKHVESNSIVRSVIGLWRIYNIKNLLLFHCTYKESRIIKLEKYNLEMDLRPCNSSVILLLLNKLYAWYASTNYAKSWTNLHGLYLIPFDIVFFSIERSYPGSVENLKKFSVVDKVIPLYLLALESVKGFYMINLHIDTQCPF